MDAETGMEGRSGMNSGKRFMIATVDHMPPEWRGSVVAIGNFDGVHSGHQAVLAAARAEAAHIGAPLIMLTFEPHPRTFFRPQDPVFRLTPLAIKGAVAGATGVDGVLVMAFDAELSAMSADRFVRDILVGKLAIRHAVTGYDFHFGHKRQGTPDFLKQAGIVNEFGVTIVSEHGDEGGAVSSTRIRESLARGGVREASELLGWTWSVDGAIVHGEKRGRELGFPTANITLNPECRLRHGIYAVRFTCSDGSVHDGVASYGRRPTFDDGPALLETHLFSFSGDLYGQLALVSLVDWIRPELKFEKIADLVSRMEEDHVEATRMLERCAEMAPDPAIREFWAEHAVVRA